MNPNKKLICAVSLLPLIFCLKATADEVILDDLIVTNNSSVCVGSTCADGEIFDSDTLKLKSDTPQIRFVDTSSSSGFPTSDWTMGVADLVTGTSFFYINDANADTAVMKLSAGASGGVALGADSELVDNAVSVGSLGLERRITHVADGVAPTDAVNVGQFDQFQDGYDAQLTDLEAQIAEISTRIDDLVTLLESF